MRAAATPLAPEDLGTILAVFAHPDDETYLAAGVLAAARDNGQRVVCITATAGEHGTDDPERWPPSRLGPVRRWEAAAAMAVLGVVEHHVLDFCDGQLQPDDPAAVRQLTDLVHAVAPDTILTFGPDGMTFHPDHIAVHHWVTTAWRRDGGIARLLYSVASQEALGRHGARLEEWGVYMTDERPVGVRSDRLDVHVQLSGAALDRKLTALRAMATQTSGIAASHPAFFAAQAAEECFVVAPTPRRVRA